jgi:SAM-dependent methyltransferase
MFKDIIDVYQEAYQKHGDTPQGFLWSTAEQTPLRLQTLSRLVDKLPFTAIDFGCGSGVLVPYLEPGLAHYVGVDINPDALEAAREKFPDYEFRENLPETKVDYVFVSGTFNLKMYRPDQEWSAWVMDQISELWKRSIHGMAISFLTYRPDWRRDFLWYPDNPRVIIDFVSKIEPIKCSHVLEDYGIRGEWTLFLEK